MVEFEAPALVSGVLGEDGAANGIAHGMLLTGIGAQLATQDRHRIGALAQRPVIPALDGGEAEAHGLARSRMLPSSVAERADRGLQLALVRWRGQ